MAQWKKLLFNHDVSDVKGEVWKFSFGKAIVWAIFFLFISITVYGMYFTKSPGDFFRMVILYMIIISVAVVAILISARTISRGKELLTRFLLIFISLVFVYGIVGMIFNEMGIYPFYMGFTTWIVLTALAGYGATRDYIFNGNIDRHDAFYCLLVFVIIVGGNFPITGNSGVIENIDVLVGRIMDYIPMLTHVMDRLPVNNTTVP